MVLSGDLPNLRDTRHLLTQIGILGTANCLKNSFSFYFLGKSSFYRILVQITFFRSHSMYIDRKNKVYNSDKHRGYTWKIYGRLIRPNLAGQISSCLIKDPRGRRFWLFSDQIFCNEFIIEFSNIKSLLRDYTGSNVSLTTFQSRSNVKYLY